MKRHSPGQKSSIFASPIREGAKGGFAAEPIDKLQFVRRNLGLRKFQVEYLDSNGQFC